MRCPKCSFFSFDDLSACAKCSKDLSSLVEDLQGTCSEISRPFFLSSVVESLEPEDQTYSESHALPPTDDTDLSFDDTLSGGGISLSAEEDNDPVLSDLDESIEISSDEISLELGDVMPIDLDQLDEPIDLEEGITANDDIDLNFTDDVSDQNDDFDATEILSADAFDDDIDLDLTGNFSADDGLDLSENFDSFDLDETSIASAPVADNTDETGTVELDDSLLEELQAGPDEDQSTNDLSVDLGDDLADFDLDETSIALEPISTPESIDANDTLSGEEALSLDDLPLEDFEFEEEDEELLGDDLLAATGPELELDLPAAELTSTDSPLDDLSFEMEGEDLLGDELLTTADTDLDLEQPEEELTATDSPLENLSFLREDEEATATTDTELNLDQPDAGLTSTDSPLEDLSFVREDEDSTATADEELDLSANQPEEELTLDDSPIEEELDFDAGDEEQLGDELLATMDEELDLDFDELDSGGDNEELVLDDSTLEEPAPSNSPALGLDEIDVSDLLSSPEGESEASLNDEEIDLTSLMEDDAESDDSVLDLLDEDIPDIELN